MKKSSFILILLIAVFQATGQKVEIKTVIEVSDKLLLDAVKQHVYQYFNFRYDNGSFYLMGDRTKQYGYVPKKPLLSGKRLRKGWTEVWVRYNFHVPGNPALNSATWVKLNRDLALIEPIELDFVPDFVWRNEVSDFISVEEAIMIGTKNLKDTTLGRSAPYFTFDPILKRYIYSISNYLTKSVGKRGKESGMMEVLKLDAETGEVIELILTSYGFQIR